MGEPARRLLTYDEYLAEEALAETKHEYADGQIWAMAGGSLAHADLGGAAYAALRAHLAGKPCRPLNSDARLHIPALGISTYPDVSVVCGGTVSPAVDRDAYTNPTVLVEVLSPSTEGYDRGEKFRRYRTLDSLRAYVLVATHAPLVEVLFRAPDDTWSFRAFGPGQVIPLDCIGVALPVDDLYVGVTLDPAPRVPRSRHDDADV